MNTEDTNTKVNLTNFKMRADPRSNYISEESIDSQHNQLKKITEPTKVNILSTPLIEYEIHERNLNNLDSATKSTPEKLIHAEFL